MSKSRVNDAAFINVSVICHLFLFVVLVYIFHRHLKGRIWKKTCFCSHKESTPSLVNLTTIHFIILLQFETDTVCVTIPFFHFCNVIGLNVCEKQCPLTKTQQLLMSC